MIPRTSHGLDSWECLSALQKCIRRGMEREAMEFAVELMHTSKAFHTMTCNRLLVISYEDCDSISQPWVVPYVACAVEQAMKWYDPVKVGRSRMAVGSAIMLMCRAAKSRQADHFSIAVGLASEIGGFVPVIPDWALDQHTLAGRKLGRGLKHFRDEGAKLVPTPAAKDRYEDEAYRLLALKAAQPKRRKVSDGDLFGG